MKEIFCRTVTLKVTYKGMKKITWSKSGDGTNKADEIYNTAASLLDTAPRRPVRLVGISLSGFMNEITRQLSLFDPVTDVKDAKLDAVMLELQRRYGMNIVKTGSELVSEKRLYKDREEESKSNDKQDSTAN